MTRTFNDLLTSVGIKPADVCIVRHHTPKRGKDFATLHDLWRDDPAGFARYQATQEAGRPLFRKRKIWAAFVCPAPDETMFIGLFDSALSETRKADWLCDYRGDEPGDGEPVDIFTTQLRSDLAAHAGVLRVEWPGENRRSWSRKAEKLSLPISALQPKPTTPLVGEELVAGLERHGFATVRTTRKLVQLRRGDLVVYVKRETATRSLVIHPHYIEIAEALRALGVEISEPARTYVNSNLRAFPAYHAEHRETEGRHGLAVGVTASQLGPLIELLDRGATITTPDGEVRAVAPEEDPLTERERLQAARIGQGEFRDRLMIYWNGACPVAGVDHGALLRASHIKAWRDATNAERLDPFNGILLCAHIDALFDRHLITFEDDGRIRISSQVSVGNRARLGLDPTTRITGFDKRHASYLAHHRRRFRP